MSQRIWKKQPDSEFCAAARCFGVAVPTPLSQFVGQIPAGFVLDRPWHDGSE